MKKGVDFEGEILVGKVFDKGYFLILDKVYVIIGMYFIIFSVKIIEGISCNSKKSGPNIL